MKFFLTLMLILLIFSSCSKDQLEDSNANGIDSMEVEQNNLVPDYPDLDSFMDDYNNLSVLNSKDQIDDWLNEKGHVSLLTVSDSIYKMSDSLGVIYSDAFMALFNKDGRAKIGSEDILLNKNTLYALGVNSKNKNLKEIENLSVFGKIRNLQESSNFKNPGEYIPNANRWKTYVDYYNNKKQITELYNETLIFDGNAYSSKMFFRFRIDYESCSFWRCTWKNDTGTQRVIDVNITFGGINTWPSAQYPYGYNIINTTIIAKDHYNFLIANHNQNGVESQNFYINGDITITIVPTYITDHVWEIQNLSWY
jgi:hypothetical protein